MCSHESGEKEIQIFSNTGSTYELNQTIVTPSQITKISILPDGSTIAALCSSSLYFFEKNANGTYEKRVQRISLVHSF